MSKTLMTVYRAYATIEHAAKDCRQIGDLATAMSFDIVEFIKGPLKSYFRGRLCIEILEDDRLQVPAEVGISSDRSNMVLRVRSTVWYAASAGVAEAKRILAHEIGHIWLHQDARFEFSEVNQEEHKFIQSEYLVEWQAHAFADAFLVPLDAIRGFSKLEDLVDYCDYYHPLPEDLVERRFLVAQDGLRSQFKPIYGGDICPRCGGEHVRSLFSYRACDNCSYKSY